MTKADVGRLTCLFESDKEEVSTDVVKNWTTSAVCPFSLNPRR